MSMLKKMLGKDTSGTEKEIGRELKIGKYTVTIEHTLGEGGFAVVYLVRDQSGTQFALKKVRVSDQESLECTSREIEVMKTFENHTNIVSLAASDMRPSGKFAEYMLLMEFCPGGHVVDIMNRRIKKPFDEREVLKIFTDVCLALAAMHHQEPPIIHRDIKPENVLLAPSHGCFKLCDFGSATTKVIEPGKDCAIAISEEEIGKYTTLQYRAPEMVDMYRNQTINEKSDIWAMGCFLYKMCFFKDCFEESTLAILSARYDVPEKHNYSEGLIALLGKLLEPDPSIRPDIDDVTDMAFQLRGLPNPLKKASRRASRASVSFPPSHPLSERRQSMSTLPKMETLGPTPVATPTATPARAKKKANPFDAPATPSRGVSTPAKDPFASTPSRTAAPTSPGGGNDWGFFAEEQTSPAPSAKAADPFNPFAASAASPKAPRSPTARHRPRANQSAPPRMPSAEDLTKVGASPFDPPAASPFGPSPFDAPSARSASPFDPPAGASPFDTSAVPAKPVDSKMQQAESFLAALAGKPGQKQPDTPSRLASNHMTFV